LNPQTLRHESDALITTCRLPSHLLFFVISSVTVRLTQPVWKDSLIE